MDKRALNPWRLQAGAGRAALAALVLACAAGLAWACSVPVFRYALERWPPEPYTVYVFHRGPLEGEAETALAQLAVTGAGGARLAPLDVRIVDLAAEPDAEAAKVWARHASAALPWMVVRYSEGVHIPVDAWAGPLTAENVGRALDSPARRQVARRLLGGDAVVFVLLEGGDKAEDDRLAALLETELKRLEKSLKLPGPVDGTWGDPVYDRQGAPPGLKLALASMRLSRTDPAEAAFVQMLTGTERDLRETPLPMVFAMFGRGRVLCALVGKGITAGNIEDVCGFLTGPCSCIAKSENPGVDVLMAVDWDAGLAGAPSAIPQVTPPPLAGVSEFARPQAEGAAGGPASEAPAARVGRSSVVLGLLLAAAGGVGIVAVVGLLLWRRGRAARNSP